MRSPGIQSTKLTLWVLSVIWGFILIVVTVGNAINHGSPSYNSPTPVSKISLFSQCFLGCLLMQLGQYWCWISKAYLPWRLFAEYFWFWFALLLSLVTYIPIGIHLWNNRRPQRPNDGDGGQTRPGVSLAFLA